jgi:hypothetical protein
MTTGAEKIAVRSAAERMRRFRRRRRNGMVCVRVQLGATDIDALIARGYLPPNKREDLGAVADAADWFLGEVLGNWIDGTDLSSAE